MPRTWFDELKSRLKSSWWREKGKEPLAAVTTECVALAHRGDRMRFELPLLFHPKQCTTHSTLLVLSLPPFGPSQALDGIRNPQGELREPKQQEQAH